jgi:hypothetical protein
MIWPYSPAMAPCDEYNCICHILTDNPPDFMLIELECAYCISYNLVSRPKSDSLFVKSGIHDTIFEISSATIKSNYGGFRLRLNKEQE